MREERNGLTGRAGGAKQAFAMAIDLRPVIHIIGLVLMAFGTVMLFPAALDLAGGLPDWLAFVTSGIAALFLGGSMALATANAPLHVLDGRQAFVLTVGIWGSLSLFGALPFMLGPPWLSFTDAVFEAVSGITTTGSTVIVGLDDLPPGINLWRGMLNWIGGLGIAFVAMIFLPVMRVGGMQFFKTEGFDTMGKVLPRAADIARALVNVYAGLTFACIAVYTIIGMTPLDAVVNAAATIATGGFSPSDISFNKYSGAGEYAGALFMVLGSLPYIRYVQMVTGSPSAVWRDLQVRGLVKVLATAVAVTVLWRMATSDQAFEPVFREALFNLTSILTGTGFFSGSFGGWGPFAMVVALICGFIGGCSGSSSGALTIFRVQVMMRAVAQGIQRIAEPNRVSVLRYDGRPVSQDTLAGVMMFVNGYIVTLGVLSVAMTLTGVDVTSAIFSVWSSMGNIGYGYGAVVGETGTYRDLGDAGIWIMTLAMLLGRLGLLAIFVLALPRFWRA